MSMDKQPQLTPWVPASTLLPIKLNSLFRLLTESPLEFVGQSIHKTTREEIHSRMKRRIMAYVPFGVDVIVGNLPWSPKFFSAFTERDNRIIAVNMDFKTSELS